MKPLAYGSFGGGRGARRRLLGERAEMENGIVVPPAQSFNHERDKNDSVGLTWTEVFVHLLRLHRIESGAGGFGRAWED